MQEQEASSPFHGGCSRAPSSGPARTIRSQSLRQLPRSASRRRFAGRSSDRELAPPARRHSRHGGSSQYYPPPHGQPSSGADLTEERPGGRRGETSWRPPTAFRPCVGHWGQTKGFGHPGRSRLVWWRQAGFRNSFRPRAPKGRAGMSPRIADMPPHKHDSDRGGRRGAHIPPRKRRTPEHMLPLLPGQAPARTRSVCSLRARLRCRRRCSPDTTGCTESPLRRHLHPGSRRRTPYSFEHSRNMLRCTQATCPRRWKPSGDASPASAGRGS